MGVMRIIVLCVGKKTLWRESKVVCSNSLSLPREGSETGVGGLEGEGLKCVLFAWGCHNKVPHNKIPESGSPKTMRIYSFTVLDAAHVKLR